MLSLPKTSECAGNIKPKDAIALRDDAALIIRELAPSFLYVHFYSGDISTEHLPIIERVRRPLDSFTSASDPVFRDTLVEIITQTRSQYLLSITAFDPFLAQRATNIRK